MKPFNEIIKEYQLLNSAKVQELLETHDLLDIMQNTHLLLNLDSFKLGKRLNISSLVSNFLTISSARISSIQSEMQKTKVEYTLINLSEKILKEYIRKNYRYQRVIISQIEEAINTTCNQCRYDFGPYQKLLKYKMQSIKIKLDKTIKGSNTKVENTARGRSVYWLEKGKLYELVDILKKKKYIISTIDLFNFFQPSNNGIIVQWNPEKKYHMAYLLYRLFNENFARIRGNRGYFSCAEMMFSEIGGKPFKRNSLKKISSKICKEKERYSLVRKEVDAIITKITKRTNGL